MRYILNGRSMRSAEHDRMMAEHRTEVKRESNIQAQVVLEVEDAFLEFSPPSERFCPYLLLLGRPIEIRSENFPYGIESLKYYRQEDRSLVPYRYELTRENLTDMVSKGMFESTFVMPDIIKRNQFELPCSVSYTCVPPEGPGVPPILFASVEQGSLSCSDITSGYEISDYFALAPESEREYNLQMASLAKQPLRTLERFEQRFQALTKEAEEHVNLRMETQEVAERATAQRVDNRSFTDRSFARKHEASVSRTVQAERLNEEQAAREDAGLTSETSVETMPTDRAALLADDMEAFGAMYGGKAISELAVGPETATEPVDAAEEAGVPDVEEEVPKGERSEERATPEYASDPEPEEDTSSAPERTAERMAAEQTQEEMKQEEMPAPVEPEVLRKTPAVDPAYDPNAPAPADLAKRDVSDLLQPVDDEEVDLDGDDYLI